MSRLQTIPSPFKRVPSLRGRRRTRSRSATVVVKTRVPFELHGWLDDRARAMKSDIPELLRTVLEFYRAACTAQDKVLAADIIRIFPPGTNGIEKPFAQSSDTFRESLV